MALAGAGHLLSVALLRPMPVFCVSVAGFGDFQSLACCGEEA